MPKERTVVKIRSCPACPGFPYRNVYSHIQTTHRIHPPSNRGIRKGNADQDYIRALANSLKDNNLTEAKLLLKHIEDNMPHTKHVKCTICKSRCMIKAAGFNKHLRIYHAFNHILEESKSDGRQFATNKTRDKDYLSSTNESDEEDEMDFLPVFSNPYTAFPKFQPVINELRSLKKTVSDGTKKLPLKTLTRPSESNKTKDTAIIPLKTNSLPALSTCCIDEEESLAVDSMPRPERNRAKFNIASAINEETQTTTSPMTVQESCVPSFPSVNEVLTQETNDTKEYSELTDEINSTAMDSTATQPQIQEEGEGICLQDEINDMKDLQEIASITDELEKIENELESAGKRKCPFVWDTPTDSPILIHSELTPEPEICSIIVQNENNNLHVESSEMKMERDITTPSEIDLVCPIAAQNEKNNLHFENPEIKMTPDKTMPNEIDLDCAITVQEENTNLYCESPKIKIEPGIPMQNEINLKCCACPDSLSLDLDKHTVRKHQITNHDSESITLRDALKTNNFTKAKRIIRRLLKSLPDEKKILCLYCNHKVDLHLFRNHLSDFHKLSTIITEITVTDANKPIKIEPEVIDLTQDEIDDADPVEMTFCTNWSNCKTFEGLGRKPTLSIVKSESPTVVYFFETPPGTPDEIKFSQLLDIDNLKSTVKQEPSSFESCQSTDDDIKPKLCDRDKPATSYHCTSTVYARYRGAKFKH